MVSLMQRRHEMMQMLSSVTPVECPYITDGLIFWLDGINRGGIAGQWKDLIGGKIFTLVNCTENSDGVTFNGSSSYGVYNGAISENWKNETLEIARGADTQTSACLLCPAGTNSTVGAGFIMNSSMSDCAIQIDGSSRPRIAIGKSWKIFSANNTLAIKDGSTVLTAGSGDYWGKNQSGDTYIGCRYTTSMSKYFSGKLVSIRIYNRQLTEAEIKANQSVDLTRFNL